MKETILTDIFLNAGFFLALSALIIPALRYLKIPVSLGYLFAGIALGPDGLGAFIDQLPILKSISLKDADHVKILAELGIVLLLFVIGLELTVRRLWQMRNFVFGLGGAQVIVSSLFIGTVAYLWGNSVQISILLGLGLALSSTAIIIQWLHEKKLFVTHVGRASFSILLLQDLAVVPILLLLTVFTTPIDGSVYEFFLWSLLKMVGTILFIYMMGKIVLKPVFIFANKHGGSEVFVALSLLTIVISSLIASSVGLSMALGAFIAGVLLADTEYRHEVSSLIVPFKSLLLGIFFFSFGMGINLHFIVEEPLWLPLSIIGLMGSKALIIFALCKLWKQSTAVSVEAALLLSQAGEFGLLVIGSALTANLIDQSVGQFMLIIIGITMLLTPLICPLARNIGLSIEKKGYQEKAPSPAEEEIDQHVVIFGFGRIGRIISERLSKEGLDILGFDKDIQTVHNVRAHSCPVYYGDAVKKSTHEAAQIDKAVCVVVTIDDPKATKKIVHGIRKINEKIPIVVRTHDEDSLDKIKDIENVSTVAEDLLISSKLSNKALEFFSYKKDI